MSQHETAPVEISGFSWVPDFAKGHVRDLRARWACEEADIPYEMTLIHAGEEKPAHYLERQPFGQVPALRDGDIEMFESGAILLHLGEKSEHLMPRDPAGRAATQSWLFAALNSIESFGFELFFINVVHAKEDWARLRRPSAEALVRARLAPVSRALGDQPYLTGRFTIADIAMATVLRDIDRDLPLAEFPNLDAYLKRCIGRPAFRRALDAQMADFTGAAPAGFSN